MRSDPWRRACACAALCGGLIAMVGCQATAASKTAATGAAPATPMAEANVTASAPVSAPASAPVSTAPVAVPVAAPAAVPAAAPAPASALSPGEAQAIVYEDFESTAVGQIPAGFTSTGRVAVADDTSFSGKHSLKVEAATNGARRITLRGDKVTALGGTFWGRLYYKVQTPFPQVPTAASNQVVHSTFVAGTGISPLFNDRIEVRMLDTVMNNKGMHQYIYNVQPPGGRKEFGKGSQYLYRYTSDWTLAEWYVDYNTQTYRLFINGQEITGVAKNNGAGNFNGTEIPQVFQSLSFGLYNYQAAPPGFVVWIDDIALGKERIGPHVNPAPAH